MKQKGFTPIIILLVVVAFGALGYFAIKTIQPKPSPTYNPESIITPISTPSVTDLPKQKDFNSLKFIYKNFSVNYPKNWSLLELDKDNKFPLKERLFGEKIIALKNINLFMIITITKEGDAVSEGIFLDDTDYQNFISDKDAVKIGNSIFYLSKNHAAINELLESHGGDYGWSALAEYIPNKVIPQTGKIYKGYQNLIKRNGYAYNIILVAETSGQTDHFVQGEIISILETIKW